MFKNLSLEEKENKFSELISYAEKIENEKLKKVCIEILKDYKEDILARAGSDDGRENIKGIVHHQCFDGGLIHHILNVTRNAYNIGLVYKNDIDIDLVLFGAILHDIGKVKIIDRWNENGEVKSNLNYSYYLVDHLYIGENIIEQYLNKEDISEKLKYQVLHIIATHMDTMDKHMAEAYIVSYADSIDADIENIISYPRNDINPVLGSYIYESENK